MRTYDAISYIAIAFAFTWSVLAVLQPSARSRQKARAERAAQPTIGANGARR